MDFAIAGVEVGKLNAMVKNVMKQMAINDAGEAVRRINSGLWIVSEPPKPKLLEFLGTVSVSETTKKFVAKKKFVINIGDDAVVKIYGLGDRFKAEFLSKVEKPFPGSELRQQKLRETSVDGFIIAEIGGEAKAETTLVEVFAMMEKQGKGESGTLLTNGYENIFYVRNVKGVLRAVLGSWDGDSWGVSADSVKDPNRRHAGSLVFSRNF